MRCAGPHTAAQDKAKATAADADAAVGLLLLAQVKGRRQPKGRWLGVGGHSRCPPTTCTIPCCRCTANRAIGNADGKAKAKKDSISAPVKVGRYYIIQAETRLGMKSYPPCPTLSFFAMSRPPALLSSTSTYQALHHTPRPPAVRYSIQTRGRLAVLRSGWLAYDRGVLANEVTGASQSTSLFSLALLAPLEAVESDCWLRFYFVVSPPSK